MVFPFQFLFNISKLYSRLLVKLRYFDFSDIEFRYFMSYLIVFLDALFLV